MRDDKNLTGKAASATAYQLHAQFVAAQEQILRSLEQLVEIHKSDVAAEDRGNLENIARHMANADDANQHPLTQIVNRGINQNEADIIASLERIKVEYPFMPDRMKEKPDPYMPTHGLRPTMEQAITHAVHEAVRADNSKVLAALWQKIKFTTPDDYLPFLMEVYQGAGYYQGPGTIERLSPRPAIFKLVTTSDYLGCLPTDHLNALLITMAGHRYDVHHELGQFLKELPTNKKPRLNYTAALRSAACNESKTEIGSKDNVELLLPLAPQQAKNDVYKIVACMQPRLAHVGMKESPAAINMANILLVVTEKPLPADTLSEIARTGAPTNLRNALEHGEAKDLPGVLSSMVKVPSIASEENTLIVLKKIKSSAVPFEPDLISAVLDHAVLKGHIALLKSLVDLPETLTLLNAKETKLGHPNEGGNRILYKAAIYVGPGAQRSAQEKHTDVERALTMLKILHNEGRGAEIPVIQGARGKGILNTIVQRITTDAPDLATDDYLTILRSRLDMHLAADRARTEETARLQVRAEHGLLELGGSSPQTTRLMLETRQLAMDTFRREADELGLTGAERAAHIKNGLDLITPAPPTRLALGTGNGNLSSAQPPHSSDHSNGVIDAEVVPPVRRDPFPTTSPAHPGAA